MLTPESITPKGNTDCVALDSLTCEELVLIAEQLNIDTSAIKTNRDELMDAIVLIQSENRCFSHQYDATTHWVNIKIECRTINKLRGLHHNDIDMILGRIEAYLQRFKKPSVS
jgi:hypothetical protein